MGYRSQVRSLIYGDPDEICRLVAAQALQGKPDIFAIFGESLTRYRVMRNTPNHEAGEIKWREVEVEVLDLSGDSWKWYSEYEDVKAWHAFMSSAEELGLDTEFVRIGEDDNDIERAFSGDDPMLGVSSSIVDDIPDPIPDPREGE